MMKHVLATTLHNIATIPPSLPPHLPVLPCAPNRFMKTLALVPALNLSEEESEVMLVLSRLTGRAYMPSWIWIWI